MPHFQINVLNELSFYSQDLFALKLNFKNKVWQLAPVFFILLIDLIYLYFSLKKFRQLIKVTFK